MKLPPIAEVRKLVVAVLGVLAECLNAGLLHGTAAGVAAAVIVLATAAGVYVVPNEPAAGGSKPAG